MISRKTHGRFGFLGHPQKRLVVIPYLSARMPAGEQMPPLVALFFGGCPREGFGLAGRAL